MARQLGGKQFVLRGGASPDSEAVVGEAAEQAVICLARGDDMGRGRGIAVEDQAGVEHIFPFGLRLQLFIGAVVIRLDLGRAQRILVDRNAGRRGLRGFVGHDCPPRLGAPSGGRGGGRTIYAMRWGVGQGKCNSADAGLRTATARASGAHVP